jgi:hypothetical protein
MARGRPPQGAEIVETLEGSLQAKQRLRVVLLTLTGVMTVAQACEILGIGETRFHDLRKEVLRQSLAALEPRLPGRPPASVSAEGVRVAELGRQVQSLTADLRAAQIREELALALPHRVRQSVAEVRAKKKRMTGPVTPADGAKRNTSSV